MTAPRVPHPVHGLVDDKRLKHVLGSGRTVVERVSVPRVPARAMTRPGDHHQTSVPGVYAAGDATTPAQQIVIAAASGAQAAMMINRDLVRAGVAATEAMSTAR